MLLLFSVDFLFPLYMYYCFFVVKITIPVDVNRLLYLLSCLFSRRVIMLSVIVHNCKKLV